MAETFFQTANHRERFVKTMLHIGKVEQGKFDPEYSSAVYILTSGSGLWSKLQSYVDRHGIGFEEILHEVDLSGGQLVLVQLAANLFNNTQHVDPLEFLRLDGGNFRIALAAIRMRRDGVTEDDVKDTSPIFGHARRITRMIRIEEKNNPPMPLTFDTTAVYSSDDLPEWFAPLQPIVEDESFTDMVIHLGSGKTNYHIGLDEPTS